jgi:hypothetical protein
MWNKLGFEYPCAGSSWQLSICRNRWVKKRRSGSIWDNKIAITQKGHPFGFSSCNTTCLQEKQFPANESGCVCVCALSLFLLLLSSFTVRLCFFCLSIQRDFYFSTWYGWFISIPSL